MAKPHHIISIRGISKQWLQGKLFPLVREMREVVGTGGSSVLAGKNMVTLFYGPQGIKPTRISFEAAMLRLGGALLYTVYNTTVIPRGGALEAIITLANAHEADIIVLEHPTRTAAQRVARHSHVPIINAGNGVDHGPTEAFSLAFTMQDVSPGQHSDLRFRQAENNLYVRMALLQMILG